jgi:hypothetical protein
MYFTTAPAGKDNNKKPQHPLFRVLQLKLSAFIEFSPTFDYEKQKSPRPKRRPDSKPVIMRRVF